MDFGLFSMFSAREGFTQSETFNEWFGLVRLAEDAGLDTFWFGESHFRPHRAVMASPLIGASAAASMTSRIGMGLAVQVLPLANPLRVAEEAAMVDHISQGRLLFGVGRSSFIESYQGYNVDYGESRSRFCESLEIIQKAWTESSFPYHGEHYDFDNVNLTPKPLQTPHPPIRVAVESRETFSLIGSLGFPIFIRHQMDVPELKELLDGYKEQRELAGFDGPNDVILQLAAYVGNSREEARTTPEASTMRARRLVRESLSQAADEEAYERLKRISEVTYDDVLTRVAYGTPEEVADRIRWYREELGITGVSLDMNPGGQLSQQQVSDSIKLLADKVVPEFR